MIEQRTETELAVGKAVVLGYSIAADACEQPQGPVSTDVVSPLLYCECRKAPGLWQPGRAAMTLPELLVGAFVAALITVTLGAVSEAVLDAHDHSRSVGECAQAARAIFARIQRQMSASRQVIPFPGNPDHWPGMEEVLILWQEDGAAGDPDPGEPNWHETVIYAPRLDRGNELLELRPRRRARVPLNNPVLFYLRVLLFRSGREVEQPTVLMENLAGVHFQIEEFDEPEGIAALRQHNVLVGLAVQPSAGPARLFFGSAVLRFVASEPRT